MEITLEKIELVKDRTGVSYKEAKEALEAAEGSVVDAIIAIEENVDLKKPGKVNAAAGETLEKIKEFIKKGNIAKISVKKDDETFVNIPVNVGIVGTLLAPWGVVAAAIAAFGFKCRIELMTDDGRIIDISEKAEGVASDVKEKGSVVFDEVMAKGTDVVNEVKEKGTEAYSTFKEVASEKIESLKKKGEDSFEDLEDLFDDFCDKAEEKVEEKAEAASEKIEDICDTIEEKIEDNK